MFDLIKLRWPSRNEKVTHEKILNELCAKISELANIRTDWGSFSDIVVMIIAAIRGVKAFELVYTNLRKQLQGRNSAMSKPGLEAAWVTIRTNVKQGGTLPPVCNQNAFMWTAKELFESFLVDRQIQK